VSDEHPVQFTRRAEVTVLEGPSPEQQDALDAARGDLVALRAVAARWPSLLEAWAALAETTTEPVDRYAYARVGYHRGLDALRHAGWRGSGEVPAESPSNLGFLRSLNALRIAAAELGEDDEATRCELFLHQLDPNWTSHLPS
jgi:Protein of unknown function (DUF3151)